MKRILLLILLVSTLTGCAAAFMNSWLGRNQYDLIALYGLPQQRASDGHGGTILVYTHDYSFAMPGSTFTRGSYYGGTGSTYTVVNPSQSISGTEYRTFFVNAQDIIYRVGWD